MSSTLDEMHSRYTKLLMLNTARDIAGSLRTVA